MRRIKTPLAFFSAFLSCIPGKSLAATEELSVSIPTIEGMEPVQLRPLNLPGDNLFAAHRSHSSHSSHRSSSGGGSTYRAPPTPYQEPARKPVDSSRSFNGAGSNQPTDPGRAAPVSPNPSQASPKLSNAEKRKLQIMQVQIALTSMGVYQGPVDGVLGGGTKEALKRFQSIKGIKQDGLMSTETLNALGIAAVR